MMKTIKYAVGDDLSTISCEAREVLERGQLICLPCHGSYRILADLTNTSAIKELFHSKHRIKKSPALIFVPNEKALWDVAARHSLHSAARKLARQFWPGPLTLIVEPHEDIPVELTRQLETGHVGVRISESPLIQEIITALGKPLLVSSANRQRKAGASSPAQIRKNFMSKVALFIDAGDLSAGQPSTVVRVNYEGQLDVTRPGAISLARLEEAMSSLLATPAVAAAGA
jgi:L-threonylcarbamoyladenylate synthase